MGVDLPRAEQARRELRLVDGVRVVLCLQAEAVVLLIPARRQSRRARARGQGAGGKRPGETCPSLHFFCHHEIETENEKMLSSPPPPHVALLLGVDRERLRAPEREGLGLSHKHALRLRRAEAEHS